MFSTPATGAGARSERAPGQTALNMTFLIAGEAPANGDDTGRGRCPNGSGGNLAKPRTVGRVSSGQFARSLRRSRVRAQYRARGPRPQVVAAGV